MPPKRSFLKIKHRGPFDLELLREECARITRDITLVKALSDNSVVVSVPSQANADDLISQLVGCKLRNGTIVTANGYSEAEEQTPDEESGSGSTTSDRFLSKSGGAKSKPGNNGEDGLGVKRTGKGREEASSASKEANDGSEDESSHSSHKRNTGSNGKSRKPNAKSREEAEDIEEDSKHKYVLAKPVRKQGNSSDEDEKDDRMASRKEKPKVVKGKSYKDEEDDARDRRAKGRAKEASEDEEEEEKEKPARRNVAGKTNKDGGRKARVLRHGKETIESAEPPAEDANFLAPFMALEAFIRLSDGEEPTADLLASILEDCSSELPQQDITLDFALSRCGRYKSMEEIARSELGPSEMQVILDIYNDAVEEARNCPFAILMERDDQIVLLSPLDSKHFLLFDMKGRKDVANPPYFFLADDFDFILTRLQRFIWPAVQGKSSSSKANKNDILIVVLKRSKSSKQKLPTLNLAKFETELLQEKIKKLEEQLGNVGHLADQLQDLSDHIENTEAQIVKIRKNFTSELDKFRAKIQELADDEDDD